MKVKYFAWVRERVGKTEETVEPPASVRTVDDPDGVAGEARRELRPCLPRGRGLIRARDRPRPMSKTGCDDCRRPRDCLFSRR